MVKKLYLKVGELVERFESSGKFTMLCSCLEDATNYTQSQDNIYQHYLASLAKYMPNNLEQALLMWHSKVTNKSEVIFYS